MTRETGVRSTHLPGLSPYLARSSKSHSTRIRLKDAMAIAAATAITNNSLSIPASPPLKRKDSISNAPLWRGLLTATECAHLHRRAQLPACGHVVRHSYKQLGEGSNDTQPTHERNRKYNGSDNVLKHGKDSFLSARPIWSLRQKHRTFGKYLLTSTPESCIIRVSAQRRRMHDRRTHRQGNRPCHRRL